MSSTQANTWPPLVSAASWDERGQKQLYGKQVLASTLFEADPTDEFYFPVDGLLTGYSSEGILFQNGAAVPGAERASWYLEEPGPYRGEGRAFPQRGLVLLTDAGLSILSLEDRYATWMIALRGDSMAYTHHFLDSVSGFKATSVGYQNGRVIISMDPDLGSEFLAPVFIVLDLVQDKIYMERGVYKVPTVGPYATNPAVYRVGTTISPNTCAVDPTGGTPTFWASYPELPEGLHLDAETGKITGAPVALMAERTFAIVAYNPGGSGATTLTFRVDDPLPPAG